MAKLSRDRAATTLHPRENLVGTGNLAAANAEVVLDTPGCNIVSLDVRGTFVGTLEVAGTVDGTNYTLIPIRPVLGGIYLINTTTTGVWVAGCAGYDKVRVRMTAYTSGSATTVLVGSVALLDDSKMGLVTSTLVTNTGAAAAAVTLTLPAPGVGVRHYVTYLRITRFATALLTAAATPVLVTTTNIPGTLVFSMPAEAAAQGTVFVYQEDFAYPIAGVAQNTATTIVAPATTAVIWRITAGFYVAP
jgi:hypothetical protein